MRLRLNGSFLFSELNRRHVQEKENDETGKKSLTGLDDTEDSSSDEMTSTTEQMGNNRLADLDDFDDSPPKQQPTSKPSTTLKNLSGLEEFNSPSQSTPSKLGGTKNDFPQVCHEQRIRVSQSRLGRVLGRDNLKIIQNLTKAQLDLESESASGGSDRSILVRGSADKIDYAAGLLQALVVNPDVDLHDLLHAQPAPTHNSTAPIKHNNNASPYNNKKYSPHRPYQVILSPHLCTLIRNKNESFIRSCNLVFLFFRRLSQMLKTYTRIVSPKLR